MDETQNNTPNQAPQGGEQTPQVDNTMLMSILAYIGPLVIISFLVAKHNPVVKFHIKQGLVLFVIEIAMWVLGTMSLGMMAWIFAPVVMVINLGTLVLSILGIVNVIQKKQEELPLIGHFGRMFNI